MAGNNPTPKLDTRFSEKGATPTEWVEARDRLEKSEIYWLTTVRPDGRPHVTPLIAVWLESSLYFCTGPDERKAKNLAHNPHCALTTGCNQLEGLDLVLEGTVAEISDAGELGRIADSFESKYGRRFTSPEGTWHGLSNAIRDGDALVYRIAPSTAFGFAKDEFSQTRWRF